MRPNLRDRFLENVRTQKMTSNFKSPLKDIASYYKGRNMETNLRRTVGFRKIPWSGCFEFPPVYPPGLIHNYREVMAASQVGYPFAAMPMNQPSGPYCKGCGAKLVPIKKNQETTTDKNQKLNVYHCLEEPRFDKKKSFEIKHKNYNKKFQKNCNCMVYQAIMEEEEYQTTQEDFKVPENHKFTHKKDISNVTHNQEKCDNRTSTCTNCGTIFDPLKTCGQELLVYIEQEDTKIDLKETQDKLASRHTKKKSTLKSFFSTISPRLRKKSDEFIIDEPKTTKYSDCIVTGGNCLHLLGKNIPFSDPSSDSSSTTPKINKGSACETLERYNIRKTFEENPTCNAYKARRSKLSSFSESDEHFAQTKDDECTCRKGKKKKNYMKYFKRNSPPKSENKIKVVYECTCEDKCSCEDIELGCNCDEEARSKTFKNRKMLKSLCGQLDGGIKESKIKRLFSKKVKNDPVKIEICSPNPGSTKWNKKMLLEAEDTCRCGVFDLKTPTRSKSSLVSIIGPATEMDETLSQRRFKKSEFVRTKSILEVTRGKLEPGRPASRLPDVDDDIKPKGAFKNKENRKKFIVLNTKHKRIKTPQKYNTPSCTTETTPEPLKTECYPIKTVKRKKLFKNAGISITSYIEEKKPGEYIFYDRHGTGKTPYIKQMPEGEPIFYSYSGTVDLDSNEEFSTDSLEEMSKVCSKDIDTRDIEFYDEMNSSNSEQPRKRSVHFEESSLICPLDRNIQEPVIDRNIQAPVIDGNIQAPAINKRKIRRKIVPKPLIRPEWDSSIKKPKHNRYEVEMCPHGSSFNIVSKLKSDSTLPLQQRHKKNAITYKNVQKNFLKNNIPKQDYLIYHMSQNLNTNIDKQIEYLTRKHPENNNNGQKVNLSTAIEALDKLSLENARNPKDPQVYTCFCRHFPEESESETDESSSLDPQCMREEKLENIFPGLENNLVKRNDVDVISLIANVLGMKHPLVQPPDLVLKKEKGSHDKAQEAPKETEEKGAPKINVQRLEKKVERDIKLLDTELEERKALVGTLKEKIIQEKEKLDAEKNRLDTRNSELGRIDPVTGEVLPGEPKDEREKSVPPKGN